MGLFSSDNIPCPNCGHHGASKTFWKVSCSNRLCPDFDPAQLSAPHAVMPASPPPGLSVPTPSPEPERASDISGTVLRYRNHKGEQKKFILTPKTFRRRGEHISACDAESYERLSFAVKRIENLSEIERVLAQFPEPSPRERQILAYYELNEKSSPAYEELKRKYPHYESF